MLCVGGKARAGGTVQARAQYPSSKPSDAHCFAQAGSGSDACGLASSAEVSELKAMPARRISHGPSSPAKPRIVEPQCTSGM
jgi:hypothetical protein